MNVAEMIDNVINAGEGGDEIVKMLVEYGHMPPDANERPAQLTAEQCAKTESLDNQISELASYIVERVPGEPSRSEGAVACAMRVMEKLLTERDAAHDARIEAQNPGIDMDEVRRVRRGGDKHLTPDRAVRILRAKVGDLEDRAMIHITEEPEDPDGYLMADIALVAGFLADHIEHTIAEPPPERWEAFDRPDPRSGEPS